MDHTPKAQARRIPWWIYTITAALLYIGLEYLAPALQTKTPWINTLLQAAPMIAPIGAISLLLLGAKALYDTPEKTLAPPECKEDKD